MVARHSRPEPPAAPAGDDLRERLDACTRELDMLRGRVRHLEDDGARFLGAATHAIVNPLTIAHSYLEIVVADLHEGLTDEQLAFVKAAHDATRRMRVLVDELVELAALETGAAEIRPDTLSCAEVVRAVLRDLEAAAEGGGVTVTCDLAADLAPVEADERKLRGALRRLVEHAIRVTPSEGTIAVSASATPGAVAIRIRDAGPEIPEGRRGEVFDPFANLPGNVGDQRRGLGLAVAKRQIAACGGRIDISNSSPSGTTFTITLPFA